MPILLAAMLLDRLKAIVGPGGWSNDPDLLAPHLTEWRGIYRGNTPLMLLPHDTQQVAEIVRACAESGTGVVPQGGNTGLCGGAIPSAAGDEILLSLSRMNAIRSVSPQDFSLVAEAGCLLAEVQAVAAEAGRVFPLSLAAEGSCQIGGNLSTDAGGINVLRYGTARNQVLGLEVVLADGSIWDGL
ncbi:MAG TPA: FAD-binding oxidoreductase, partial [Woeseiaceae bacterium]